MEQRCERQCEQRNTELLPLRRFWAVGAPAACSDETDPERSESLLLLVVAELERLRKGMLGSRKVGKTPVACGAMRRGIVAKKSRQTKAVKIINARSDVYAVKEQSREAPITFQGWYC